MLVSQVEYHYEQLVIEDNDLVKLEEELEHYKGKGYSLHKSGENRDPSTYSDSLMSYNPNKNKQFNRYYFIIRKHFI